MATSKKSTAKQTEAPTGMGEHALFEVHTGHANHLCELVSKRQMAKVARASKDSKFICHICGRAAGSADSLCEPVEI